MRVDHLQISHQASGLSAQWVEYGQPTSVETSGLTSYLSLCNMHRVSSSSSMEWEQQSLSGVPHRAVGIGVGEVICISKRKQDNKTQHCAEGSCDAPWHIHMQDTLSPPESLARAHK